ncbi:MAG: DUF86 domain-containing protein [Elusimicrobia bacterium]|nr:DUF86 domain-containing protein [Elusimicrobiota bacterium]
MATGEEERISRLKYKDTFLKLVDYRIYPKKFADGIALSAGLRNIIVHEYNDVEHQLLFHSIREILVIYEQYVNYVLKFLKRLPPEGH